jgi:hypothetical protein
MTKPEIDLTPDGVIEYSFALYNCAYCQGLTFLSLNLSAMVATPDASSPGAIVVRSDKKTGKELKRVVSCHACLKQISWNQKLNNNNEDVRMHYLGADDPKAEFEDTLTQMKRELGIPRNEW